MKVSYNAWLYIEAIANKGALQNGEDILDLPLKLTQADTVELLIKQLAPILGQEQIQEIKAAGLQFKVNLSKKA